MLQLQNNTDITYLQVIWSKMKPNELEYFQTEIYGLIVTIKNKPFKY